MKKIAGSTTYICDSSTMKVVRGPYRNGYEAAEWIGQQTAYCTASRHMLSKDGHYPTGKAGDRMIIADLLAASGLRKYFYVQWTDLDNPGDGCVEVLAIDENDARDEATRIMIKKAQQGTGPIHWSFIYVPSNTQPEFMNDPVARSLFGISAGLTDTEEFDE